MTTLSAPASAHGRMLPPDEWWKLPEEVRGALNPDHAFVAVIEAPTGEIVGHWAAMNTVHLEGLWIAEAYRKNPVAAGSLIRTMFEGLRQAGVRQVLTLSQSDEVDRLCEKFGFQNVPGILWAFTFPPPEET